MSLQDEAKQLLPYVQALAEGKTVTYAYKGLTCTSRDIISNIRWLLELFVYDEKTNKFLYEIDPTLQIKAEPTYRPYNEDELPTLFWVVLRNKGTGSLSTVRSIKGDSVIIDGLCVSADCLLRDWQIYNVDTKETFPCGFINES